ncbi:MAG: hypothetical protein ACJ8AO_07740 [Gemmatimonadaceae bacterium]
MPDATFTTLRKRLDELKAEAAKRRRVSAPDPAADALDYAADEIRVTVEELERASHELSVPEYSAYHRVSQQTVRDWIKAGRLDARRTAARGYLIKRDARVRPPARRLRRAS